jgi:hypothetical protein
MKASSQFQGGIPKPTPRAKETLDQEASFRPADGKSAAAGKTEKKRAAKPMLSDGAFTESLGTLAALLLSNQSPVPQQSFLNWW